MVFPLKHWRDWVPPLPLMAFLLFCLLLVFLPVKELLRYDRDAVMAGEWWRLFSANLVHSNFIHFLLNAASVLVQSLLFRGVFPTRIWLALSLWCAVANILGMHGFSEQYRWYVGMSGALYGVAIAGALGLLWRREWLVGGVLATYLTGRIVYEQMFGITDELSDWIEASVAIDAHLWGLISGYVAMAVLYALKPKTMQEKPLSS